VTIFDGGSGNSPTPTGKGAWIDLSSEADYDRLAPAGRTKIGVATPVGTKDALFVSQYRAQALLLIGPKLPASAGGGVGFGNVEVSKAKLRKRTRDQVQSINVSTVSESGEIITIQNKLTNEIFVEDWLDLVRLFSRYELPSAMALDLIAHSTDVEYLLQLGRWTLNPNDTNPKLTEVFKALHEPLRELGVKQIRLLGCQTAMSELARKALLAIQSVFNGEIQVYGTSEPLFCRHFDRDGFTATDLLVPASPAGKDFDFATWWRRMLNQDPVSRRLKLESLPEVTRDERPQSRWDVKILQGQLQTDELVKHVQLDKGRSLPGMLTVPSLELRIPVDPAGKVYRRVEVLFNGELMRAYPSGSPTARDSCETFVSEIYRIDNPPEFNEFIAQRFKPIA
jgi:hypothetical protein